jgi:hypothetical protein
MTKPCADCGSQRPGHRWRRLCKNCYQRHYDHGTHLNFERATWTNAELISEWEWLMSEGYTRAQVAERLGISKKRLEKAIERYQHRLQEAS